MGQSPEQILILTVLLSGIAALVFAGLLRLVPALQRLSPALIPVAFLAAYVLTYGKVPSIPPVGAVNKVFYVALAGSIIGLLAARLSSAVTRTLLVAQPVLAAAYIGQSRLAEAPWEVGLAALAGVIVMHLVAGRADPQVGTLRSGAALVAFCAGFAPIALLGASSSSLQLVMIFAATLTGVFIWRYRDTSYAFSPADLLGGLGGLIAQVMTVCMITRKANLVALALLLLVFFLPAVVGRWMPKIGIVRFSLICLAMALAAATLAILRHGTPFPI